MFVNRFPHYRLHPHTVTQDGYCRGTELTIQQLTDENVPGRAYDHLGQNLSSVLSCPCTQHDVVKAFAFHIRLIKNIYVEVF